MFTHPALSNKNKKRSPSAWVVAGFDGVFPIGVLNSRAQMLCGGTIPRNNEGGDDRHRKRQTRRHHQDARKPDPRDGNHRSRSVKKKLATKSATLRPRPGPQRRPAPGGHQDEQCCDKNRQKHDQAPGPHRAIVLRRVLRDEIVQADRFGGSTRPASGTISSTASSIRQSSGRRLRPATISAEINSP